jgi:hypothetical protein
VPRKKLKTARRGKTVAEALFPAATDQLVRLARKWCADSTDLILEAVWGGYDLLCNNPETIHRLSKSTDDLERGITRQLEPRIRERLSGYEPFFVQHGVPEDESRKPWGRPREYDIAFVFRDNPRIMWSVEAKLLKKAHVPPDYVQTVQDRYLTCEYAPFIGEGGMAGYLLEGTPEQIFSALGPLLKTRLVRPKRPAGRPHRYSAHVRSVPAGKSYPRRFRCHHMIMPFNPAVVLDH